MIEYVDFAVTPTCQMNDTKSFFDYYLEKRKQIISKEQPLFKVVLARHASSNTAWKRQGKSPTMQSFQPAKKQYKPIHLVPELCTWAAYGSRQFVDHVKLSFANVLLLATAMEQNKQLCEFLETKKVAMQTPQQMRLFREAFTHGSYASQVQVACTLQLVVLTV